MNIGNWMNDDQMALIQDHRMRKTNKNILRRKSEDYYKLAPDTPHPSDDEEDEPKATQDGNTSAKSTPTKVSVAQNKASLVSSKPKTMKTRLAMSSMISYTNDRVLSPEMMRAMIILYVGPHSRPDFSTDYLLSPLLAPEALLANFPKTFFLTGERDPLVDDTVIFAGRLRQAKNNAFIQEKELGLLGPKDEFDERDHVEVCLLPGISHGFLQFVAIFPEAWKHVYRCARWMNETFETMDLDQSPDFVRASSDSMKQNSNEAHPRHHHRRPTDSSGDEENPLMMSSSKDAEPHARSSRRGRGKRVRHQDIGRNRSMVSLASEDDLMSRRMKGLAGGLMGMTADGTTTP